jgi:hypothetical protein
MAGVDETRRQFDLSRGDFASEQQAGEDALAGYRGLVGLNGEASQTSAIDQLRNSPFYKQLYSNGEEAVLQNASATGGLRGGNTEHSLAGFGRDTLMQAIQQQLGNYGGLISAGTGADASIGTFGQNAVSAINDQRNQGASAKAGALLTKAGINAANWNNAGSFIEDSIKQIASGGMSGGAKF